MEKLILTIIFKLLSRAENDTTRECLEQWFPTGEEYLPGEEFREFRGGISTL